MTIVPVRISKDQLYLAMADPLNFIRVPPAFIAALTAILVVIGAVTAGIRFLQMQRRQEEDALAERRRRRAERLRDSGMSEADFDLMMQDRRTALAKKRKKRSHKIP